MGDPHIVLSDDDDDDDDPLLSPIRFYDQPNKKPRTELEPISKPIANPNPNPNPSSKPIASPNRNPNSKPIGNPNVASVVLIDDDDDLITQKRGPISAPKPVFSAAKFSDSGAGFISLDSDNESEGGLNPETGKENETADTGFEASQDFYFLSSNPESTSTFSGHTDYDTNMSQDFSFGSTPSQNDIPRDEVGMTNNGREATRRKKMTEEEKIRLKEEKMAKLLQEKQRKQALKAEAAELRKAEREKKKWENGKNALKSIVAEIDTKVIEMGSVGGNLLTRLSEKGINFRIASNPIKQSILWTMKIPEHMNEIAGDGLEIRYVLLVYEAVEYCNMVTNDSLFNDVFKVQSRYPSHTVCILTNKLMAYIDKKEQEQYKNRSDNSNWRRPPIEEVAAKLTTHFNKVHSRHCTDEAELAEHVVGLTFSLASCQFRKKLTRLSVNANGSAIPKDSTDKNLIKNNLWLKVLVAIPKVQPRYAVAIWKKYPTMKSLLKVYMDPSISVHEKEFLLKDLKTEGLLGDDRRLGEVCSKRVYRILCAKNGSIKTDDIEDGADFF